MTVLQITEYPAEVLAEVGAPVEAFDDALAKLCEDMFETMYAAEGVGLAASQVGLFLRLFVMDCAGVKLVAANPEIVGEEGEQTGDEGCLSVGKIGAALKRPMRVTLRAQDLAGAWYERTAEGYAARCFRHETDHCDGKLFIDRLTPLKRNMVKKKFQKLKRWG
ncbi:MAG: peptide deformylase [Pyrinomonadaceae bacterium]